ncbi:hypothetical protein KKH43_02730 [Patescibacteria group bacterium]|nr:hypothetical protein [Patescibacteria group bacterium]
MAEHEKDVWIEGGYYVDFDELGQFRIIGPNNHLYCGFVTIPREDIVIQKLKMNKRFELEVSGVFTKKKIKFFYPVMEDMRTVRQLVSSESPKKLYMSFAEIRKKFLSLSLPREARKFTEGIDNILRFRRHYGKYWYGVDVMFDRGVSVKEIDAPFRGFALFNTQGDEIPFTIKAATNDFTSYHPIARLFVRQRIDFSVFLDIEKVCKKDSCIKLFWDQAGREIKHLITWSKTSGDNYGTIFPRDYMEAADLSVHDLTENARRYMYEVTIKNVSEYGQGWHEDVVGEYRYEHLVGGRDIFDRKMIDIEPHTIMGLKHLPYYFIRQNDNQSKIRRIAEYIIDRARTRELITFKPFPQNRRKPGDVFYDAGNWRDSADAYKRVSDVIAPFDVNAVFYPEALRVLKTQIDDLELDVPDIDELIQKWDSVKDRYRFTNRDGKTAFALALYGGKNSKEEFVWKQFKVNHLDESYLYTYGTDIDPDDIASFCERLKDEKYFYTPAGPVLIARNNSHGYTSKEYHGVVIWAKQAAFVILGLSKNLKLGLKEGWDKDLVKEIRETLLITAEATMKAFLELSAIPELHVWSEKQKKPLLFTDQEGVKYGQMSKVQLWSAVAARRIARKYWEIKTQKRYKF